MTNSTNRQKAADMIRQGVILVIRGCLLLECGFAFTDFLPKDVRDNLITIDSRTSMGGTGAAHLSTVGMSTGQIEMETGTVGG